MVKQRGGIFLNKDPAFLFYSSDFLTGTYTMTDEQVGKYIRLLCLQHQHGHLSQNHMDSIIKTSDETIYAKFIKDSDGKYYNERLQEEIEKRVKYTDSRRLNGSMGGRPLKTYDNHMDNHKDSICEPYENHSENEDDNDIDNRIIDKKRGVGKGKSNLFEKFYTAYPRHIGRAGAEKAFSKIEINDVLFAKIMSVLEKWKQCEQWTKDNGQFIPYPATWLNGKRWEDELPESKQISLGSIPKPEQSKYQTVNYESRSD